MPQKQLGAYCCAKLMGHRIDVPHAHTTVLMEN